MCVLACVRVVCVFVLRVGARAGRKREREREREREWEGGEREREEASEEWAAVIDEMFEACSIRHN